jgi:hypothetical protein
MLPWEPHPLNSAKRKSAVIDFVPSQLNSDFPSHSSNLGLNYGQLRRHSMPNETSRRTTFACTRIFFATFAVLLITASLAFAHQPASSDKYSPADQRTLESYSLTGDNLKKAISATKALEKLEATDASVSTVIKHVSGETLDQTFKRIDANSKLAAALHSSGLTTKEYWMTSTTVVMAYFAEQMVSNNMPQSTIDSTLAWKASADQIAFVKAHQTEIDALMSIEKP